MDALTRVIDQLEHGPRTSFAQATDQPNHYYAVWVDEHGAKEISAAAVEEVRAGIVYVGECVTQSPRRHLAHRDIGSFTLMKNLAAIFRKEWDLRTTSRGSKLLDPGRERLRDWMVAHLTVSCAPRDRDVLTKDLLARVEPPLRIEGWHPERNPLREQLTTERAALDRG